MANRIPPQSRHQGKSSRKDVSRPSIDFILPFYGNYELVTRCVSSILACTPNQRYRIYIVDDGSPNKFFFNNAKNPRITKIRLNEHQGFGAALYAGYMAGTSPWCVFMHSDVQVKSIYWLLRMQRTMEKMKKTGIKMVSARSNDAGTIAEYDPRLIGSEDAIEDCVSDKPLPLFCALCHRDLFKMIGGFIKPYNPYWYENDELYYRMKHFKLKQAICGNAYVHHEGGATVKQMWKDNPKTKEQMAANFDICMKDIKPFTK